MVNLVDRVRVGIGIFGVAAQCAILTFLSGCATTQPVAYAELRSARYLRINPDDKTGHQPYRYTTRGGFRDYDTLIIDPAVVYRGADAQFGKATEKDRVVLARYMDEQFAQRLGQTFRIVDLPGPATLRLRLTLTGAKGSVPVAATFSRFDIAGGPYNAIQSARGREGALTGWVTYCVELYDGKTDRLLSAFVTKQYPSPMNIKATFGKFGAAMAGIRNGANQLATDLGETRDMPSIGRGPRP